MDGLPSLNALPAEAAVERLRRCCGSRRWAQAMADLRPFADAEDLFAVAKRVWEGLAPADWLEAFAAHPRIGGKDALREKFAATRAWARGEQAGAAQASEEVLAALERGNADYERRFGYIFIVCATGKSAAEMLELLRERLSHPPHKELKIAAAEQAKITQLRLRKLLSRR